MSECTCQCPDYDRYRLLAFKESAEMDAEVNRLLKLGIGWRLHGTTFTYNLGYRQAMVRDVDSRPWLLPHHAPPVQH